MHFFFAKFCFDIYIVLVLNLYILKWNNLKLFNIVNMESRRGFSSISSFFQL